MALQGPHGTVDLIRMPEVGTGSPTTTECFEAICLVMMVLVAGPSHASALAGGSFEEFFVNSA